MPVIRLVRALPGSRPRRWMRSVLRAAGAPVPRPPFGRRRLRQARLPSFLKVAGAARR